MRALWTSAYGSALVIGSASPKLLLSCPAGLPKYNQQVSFVVISDVGANWQAVFIPLGTLTAIFFFASLWLDFSLRHTYRQVEVLCGFPRMCSAAASCSLWP